MDCDLSALLAENLFWLWDTVAAAADRRGDEDMTNGKLTLTAPADAAQRASVAGLVPGGPLVAGQKRKVDLGQLADVLNAKAPGLSPGAVAAHAVRRRLGVKVRAQAVANASRQSLVNLLHDGVESLPARLSVDADEVVERLRRTGGVARLLNTPEPKAVVERAMAVLSLVPGPESDARVDRRTLVPGDPHALDVGLLSWLVHAVMGVSGLRARQAWSELGVDIDDLVGGLIVTGVHPANWDVPGGAVFTLPLRELHNIKWKPPDKPGAWVFVTENPSVLSAALQGFNASPNYYGRTPRVVCTSGTPSRQECAAVGALRQVGWRVAVRADFDIKGLAHVRALLDSTPDAEPWRMRAEDYVEASQPGRGGAITVRPSESPWDTNLAVAMSENGTPAYEEDLLPALLADIRHGSPPSHDGGGAC